MFVDRHDIGPIRTKHDFAKTVGLDELTVENFIETVYEL